MENQYFNPQTKYINYHELDMQSKIPKLDFIQHNPLAPKEKFCDMTRENMHNLMFYDEEISNASSMNEEFVDTEFENTSVNFEIEHELFDLTSQDGTKSANCKKLCKKKTNSFQKLKKQEILRNIIYQKRNTDTASKVEKLRKLKSIGKLRWSMKKNCYISSSQLLIKYMSPKDMQINPRLEFRYMDFVFPMNSDQFDESIELHMSPYNGFEKIKRASSIINNVNKQNFCVNQEDRDPTQVYALAHCSKNELEYLLQWLESLGSQKAMYFRDVIEGYKLKLMMAFDNDHQYQNQECHNPYLIGEKVPIKTKKQWVKKLDDKTKAWIKTKPHFVRLSKVTGPLKIMKVHKICYNYLLTDLLKAEPQLNGNFSGINPLLHVKVPDLYGLYMTKFNHDRVQYFEEGIEQPEYIIKKAQLVDSMENEIHGTFQNYNETYFLNGTNYFKTTIVFLGIK